MAGQPRDIDVAALRGIFRRHGEIAAAYLYGSYARGRQHRESDVDIAVLLRSRHGRLACTLPPTYQVDLAAEIERAIGHPRVEVVVLNHATPLLAWEAVRRGRRLYARDARTIIRYEIRVRQRFLDTAHLRAIQDRYLEAIIHNGFSKAAAR